MTAAESAGLISPHGGSLVNLVVPEAEREALKAGVSRRIECSHRNACDVELLVVGGFSPLRGFMHQQDYEAVVAGHRTSSGLLFGLPIVFDTDDASIAVGELLLLTYCGQELAVFTVESRWEPDKAREAQGCYGTTSIEHPAVKMIATERGRIYLGGCVQGLELPCRVFPCKTPAEVRATLPEGQTPFTAPTTSCLPGLSKQPTSVSRVWCWCTPPAAPPRTTTLPARCASRPTSDWLLR
jgi:sulfate adenylyltransferase